MDTLKKLRKMVHLSADPINMEHWQRLTVTMNLMRIYRDIKIIDSLLAGLPAEFLGQHAPANGAFYLYVDIGAISNNSGDFAQRMLREAGVAVTPGIIWIRIGRRYLRLSYVGSTHHHHCHSSHQ